MQDTAAAPFETIEDAHDFVSLLSVTVAEASREISADLKREMNGTQFRRLDALRIAGYNLERLEFHLNRSARLLNDLRSIRRLLLEERGGKPVLVTTAKTAAHSPAVPKNGHPTAAA